MRALRTDQRARYPLASVAGILSILVCVALAVAAYVVYPWAFSPMTNWISDLGNTWLNPRGAFLFRLDMVVVGFGLAVFFFGLRTLTHGQRLRTRLLILLAQASGLVASFALVMTGVYSENQESAHALWSTVLFVALAVAVMLIGWGVLYHPVVSVSVSYVALASCAVDVVSIIARSHLLEWVAVPLLLVFLAQVSVGTWKAARRQASGDAQPAPAIPPG
jgi:hypothetical protein